jgi:hypothetical protein
MKNIEELLTEVERLLGEGLTEENKDICFKYINEKFQHLGPFEGFQARELYNRIKPKDIFYENGDWFRFEKYSIVKEGLEYYIEPKHGAKYSTYMMKDVLDSVFGFFGESRLLGFFKENPFPQESGSMKEAIMIASDWKQEMMQNEFLLNIFTEFATRFGLLGLGFAKLYPYEPFILGHGDTYNVVSLEDEVGSHNVDSYKGLGHYLKQPVGEEIMSTKNHEPLFRNYRESLGAVLYEIWRLLEQWSRGEETALEDINNALSRSAPRIERAGQDIRLVWDSVCLINALHVRLADWFLRSEGLRVCANPKCTRTFNMTKTSKRYCSDDCGKSVRGNRANSDPLRRFYNSALKKGKNQLKDFPDSLSHFERELRAVKKSGTGEEGIKGVCKEYNVDLNRRPGRPPKKKPDLNRKPQDKTKEGKDHG